MDALPLFMLPGLDGTGLLFRDFRAALPPGLVGVAASFDGAAATPYAELAAGLPLPDVPFAVLGESFSGPLALRLAARARGRVVAVILVASFARCPRRALAWLAPLAAGALLPTRIPDAALRRLLLGEDAGPLDLAALRLVGRFVKPAVVAQRLAALARVDARRELAALDVPILCLRAARDALVPASAGEALRRTGARVEVRDVDGPHLLLLRRPRECACAVSEFVRARVRPAPAPRTGP